MFSSHKPVPINAKAWGCYGDICDVVGIAQRCSRIHFRYISGTYFWYDYRKCLCIDIVVSALRVVEEKTVGEIEPSEAYRTAGIPFKRFD
jgi:hypothetical protein